MELPCTCVAGPGSDYDVQGIDDHTVARVAVMPSLVVTQIHSMRRTVVINALRGC